MASPFNSSAMLRQLKFLVMSLMVDIDGPPIKFVEDSSTGVGGLSLCWGVKVMYTLDSMSMLSLLSFSSMLCMNVSSQVFVVSRANSTLELTSLEV